MRRYDIISGILLILSIIDFALAAPVLVQEKRRAGIDVVDIPEDVIAVLGKRMDEGDLGKLVENFKAWGKQIGSSDAHGSSNSVPPGPDHGSTGVVQAPVPNPESSTANPGLLMEPSSPLLTTPVPDSFGDPYNAAADDIHSNPGSYGNSDNEWDWNKATRLDYTKLPQGQPDLETAAADDIHLNPGSYGGSDDGWDWNKAARLDYTKLPQGQPVLETAAADDIHSNPGSYGSSDDGWDWNKAARLDYTKLPQGWPYLETAAADDIHSNPGSYGGSDNEWDWNKAARLDYTKLRQGQPDLETSAVTGPDPNFDSNYWSMDDTLDSNYWSMDDTSSPRLTSTLGPDPDRNLISAQSPPDRPPVSDMGHHGADPPPLYPDPQSLLESSQPVDPAYLDAAIRYAMKGKANQLRRVSGTARDVGKCGTLAEGVATC